MKIYIISSVFPPEPIISAQTSYEIALELSSRAHNIKVVTSFPNRPEGKLFPGYSRKLIQKENYKNQFSLIRCFSFFSTNSSIVSRTVENISFGITSGLYFLFSEKPDLVYVNTWPLFASGIIRLIASFKKVPLVISIQDVYPESLVVQGRISNTGIIRKLLTRIDKWIAQGSTQIITISNSFADIYNKSRDVSKQKVEVIPNWVNEKTIELVSKDQYRNEKGIPLNAIVIVYGGNVGVAAGVEIFINGLVSLKDYKEIFFIIAGSGSQLGVVQQAGREKPGFNFVFHSPWKREETSKVLAAADILLLPTSGNQSLVSVPSKLITYMLSAKPILAISDEKSEIANIINTANCGWVIQPEKLHEVNNFIETLITLPVLTLLQKGNSGREYALKNFVSNVCLPKVIEVIENSLSK